MPLTKNEAIGILGSGTLNYIPKFTPNGMMIGDSQIIDNGSSIGIGIAGPTAGTKLHIYRSINDFLYELKVENPNAGASSAASVLISSDSGKMEFGQLSSTHTTYTTYGQTGDTFFRSGSGGRNMNFLTDPGNVGKFLFFSRLNPTVDALTPSLAIDGTKVGFGLSVPTATAHIQGINATSADYSLKVDNSVSSPIIYGRNDQFVGLGTTTELSGTTGHKFEALSPIASALGVGKYFTAGFISSDSYGIDKGAGITFGGKYNSGGAYTIFGGINAVKETAADGAFSGRMNLWVRDSAVGVVALTAISFGSKVRVGIGRNNPTAMLHLDGDNADVFISEAKCVDTIGYAGQFLANTVNTANNVAIYAKATNGAKNYAAIFEGHINTNIQTGNAGLAAGDLYVDTAANIAANGDLVVGRKV